MGEGKNKTIVALASAGVILLVVAFLVFKKSGEKKGNPESLEKARKAKEEKRQQKIKQESEIEENGDSSEKESQ